MHFVIIGAGECGVSAAFALRNAGFDGEVTILGSESRLPYERPPLSKSGGSKPKQIRATADYMAAGINLRLGVEVEAIHPTKKQVQADGEALKYDKLLIATGCKDAEDAVRSTLGFDLRKPDFWNKSLNIITDRVRQFVTLADATTGE